MSAEHTAARYCFALGLVASLHGDHDDAAVYGDWLVMFLGLDPRQGFADCEFKSQGYAGMI